MEIRQYKDILGLKMGDRFVAFHARDLEVAEIDAGVWEAITEHPAGRQEQTELVEWLNQTETSGVEESNLAFQTLLINVTQICNLRCGYCAAGGDGTYGNPITKIELKPTFAQISQTLESMNSSGNNGHLHIEFFGGEPLLFPDIIRMLSQYARVATAQTAHKVSFKIVSNGTLASGEVIEMLKAVGPTLQISIDGPKEINDKQRVNRAGKGMTSEIEANLRQYAKIKDSLNGLELNAVFDRHHTDVVSTWTYFGRLPVDRFHFEYSLTETDSESNLEFCKQMAAVAELAFAKGGIEELLRIKRFEVDFLRLDKREKVMNFCGAGKTFHAIDAQNQVFTCPWDAGDFKEMVGRQTKRSTEKLKFYENPIVNKLDCKDCWARFLCGGGCMFSHKSATGSKTQVNSVFCTRTRSLSALSILWYARSRSLDRRTNEAH